MTDKQAILDELQNSISPRYVGALTDSPTSQTSAVASQRRGGARDFVEPIAISSPSPTPKGCPAGRGHEAEHQHRRRQGDPVAHPQSDAVAGNDVIGGRLRIPLILSPGVRWLGLPRWSPTCRPAHNGLADALGFRPQMKERWIMKKILCLLAVLAITAIAAAPAQAAKHSIDSSVKIADLETTGSPPASGTVDYAGTIKGALGSGAVVGQNIFGPLPQFHGPVRAFYAKGTLKGSLEGTGTLNADGSVSFDGTGEITKGTGRQGRQGQVHLRRVRALRRGERSELRDNGDGQVLIT